MCEIDFNTYTKSFRVYTFDLHSFSILSLLSSLSSVAWILICTPTNDSMNASFIDAHTILSFPLAVSGTHETISNLLFQSTNPQRHAPDFLTSSINASK